MPYQLSWLVEGQVILGKFSGVLTQEDMPSYDQAVTEYLDAGTTPLVHIVSDITELESMPGLGALTKFNFVKHPRMGWQIGFGGKLALNLVGNLASQVFRVRFRSFKTLDEALAFLQQVDSTLAFAQNSNGADG